MKRALAVLLVFVMLGSVIGIVVANEKLQNRDGQISPNDVFNMSRIKERSEKYSKEEIQKNV